MNPDTNNEVARLRELLNRAIEIADESWDAEGSVPREFEDRLQSIKDELARLANALEEPVIQDFRITEPDPEYRELGPDELICEGDECRFIGEPQYEPVMDSMIGGEPRRFRFYRFRTRYLRDEIQKLKEVK